MKRETTTIGLDLGEKFHSFCVLDGEGEVIQDGRVASTRNGLEKLLGSMPSAVVVVEAGTHSPWVSRVLESWGHKVLVGNPRKLRMIYGSTNKSDGRDAEMLARIGRLDPQLLYPIHHRGVRAQADLAVLKSRDALVKSRTMLINHARGVVKAVGERLPSCSADAFHKIAREGVPEILDEALDPIFRAIAELTQKIKGVDKKIAELCREEYPETERLRGVKGVGPVTSLAFVLTLEEPGRFTKSRTVPVYLGLTPRRDQSGEVDRQLRITKAGDEYLRRLLISCAHYILGPFGEDSDLRRWGLRICERGGKNGKKRAVVAVARKLAVLLHRIWVSGEDYDPFYDSSRKALNVSRAA